MQFMSLSALCVLLMVSASTPAGADERPAWLSDGEIDLSFRYRYEHVDDEGFDENADASTLRSRLSLKSGRYRGLQAFVEVDDVREIIADEFDAGGGNTPDRAEYPVVADPEGTEVNQAYLDVNPRDDTRLRVGRQRILLDNQRFVGGVGWRQNEQTFDAGSAEWRSDRLHVFYAYVDNVNRILGEDVDAGDHHQDGTQLLNAGIALEAAGTLTGYYYGIDNTDAPTTSTDTLGLRLQGARQLEPFEVRYLAEYAHQRDAANNPQDFRSDYWHVNAAIARPGYSFGAGWELLGGDVGTPGEAFRTPLGTLHAFNGWADVFLSTPDAGLGDRYLTVNVTRGAWALEARAHEFRSESGHSRFGHELDFHVGRKLGQYLQLDGYAAFFDGEETYSDVTKLWVMLTIEL